LGHFCQNRSKTQKRAPSNKHSWNFLSNSRSRQILPLAHVAVPSLAPSWTRHAGVAVYRGVSGSHLAMKTAENTLVYIRYCTIFGFIFGRDLSLSDASKSRRALSLRRFAARCSRQAKSEGSLRETVELPPGSPLSRTRLALRGSLIWLFGSSISRFLM
jgi:hypothetical protein